jgi:hypothetical protein
MARFAVAEFMHETNTFAPVKTGYEAFLSYSNVTRLIRRQDVLDHVAGANTYLEGFVRSASHRVTRSFRSPTPAPRLRAPSPTKPSNGSAVRFFRSWTSP